MSYRTGGKNLVETRSVLANPVNDCFVCRDEDAEDEKFYTVLAIRDRGCVKTMLSPSGVGERSRSVPGLFQFSDGERLCLAFPYRPERSLDRFAPVQLRSVPERERVCLALVLRCIKSELPFPLLYLVLEQDRIHLDRNNGVYFTMDLDLQELDGDRTEADCADLCAEKCIELLEGAGKQAKGLRSLKLLTKKQERGSYTTLRGLMRDLEQVLQTDDRLSLRERIRLFWKKHKTGLLRVMLILCAVILCLALLALLCRIFLGEVPFFRLFERSFAVIGTEKLG